ncbi:retrovirus-related pol polyprotein from transposon TNT 1-94 [Tanacetum coccineum]|uniref:Retrovirus-related pol polyprotein from transposon TNT 1-94 n=1 Tax=Tanacetum coccineum TaxID=301880 RepID=A0ABQ5CQV6_9ASTR
MSDSQNSLREFYKTDVILMSDSLYKNLKEIKAGLVEEVQEMLNNFESMEQQVKATRTQNQKEVDELIEHVNQKTYTYADVRAQNQDLLMTISELKNKLRTIEKGKHVNTKFEKYETLGKLVCVTPFNKNLRNKAKKVSNTKTVNAVNDGSNIVCVSCAKDVFLLSHEKCVAHYALSTSSNNKRALFTTPVAAKSKNLGVASLVAKSRLSVAKTIKAIYKVFSSSSLSHDSSQSKTLSNYMKNKIATSRKWQRWFKYQQRFNWSPKSKTTQSLPSETKSRIRVRSTSNTPITTQKWVAKMSTLPSAFVLCDSGLRHNLFLVRQFCDGDLEVAFCSNTCYVWNLEGDDLLIGSRDSNLYTISIFGMAASSLVCLMSRATSTKSWLWHRRLSHLNFGTINQFTSKYLVDGTESKLEQLHMDLCGPMRVASINGKKYILVIVDDYSRYTWVYFLRTKDKAPDMIIDFVNQVQRNLKAQILTIRTNNGTEFKNKKLRALYAKLGIVHKTSIARTPQQNDIVEHQNGTLVEAARTMLIFSKALEFLWTEAIATACFTQNCSIVHTRNNKTPYELIRGRKPNI